MTAEENRKKGKDSGQEQQKIPDFADAWKKLYFESEEAFARSIDNFVAGQNFTEFLEHMGRQYLSCYKATSQNMDRFFANNPVPSKKDIARIAELVVAVEEKVDCLESDLSANLNAMAASLIKLVDFQVILKDEIQALQKDVKSIRNQIKRMQKNQDKTIESQEKGVTAAETPPRKRDRSKKTNTKE